MKKAIKIIAVVLAVCLVASGIYVGVAKADECNYFFSSMHNAVASINDGSWLEDINGSTSDEGNTSSDTGVTFVSGEFGGIQFDTQEDAINYYVEAYNSTKGETAQYIDGDGKNVTYYALVGNEELSIDSILVDGKENSIINKLVPTIVDSLFSASVHGLPPCENRDPKLDVDENGDSLTTSRLTADDIESCSIEDNGDGTITLTLVPKASEMSHRGLDSQGRMFNTLGAIDETVESISVLSWSSGTTAENCKVSYENGTATVKIDTATGKIVEADYLMKVTVDIQHASVSVLSDKNAVLDISYTQHFPATDDYLKSSKNITRA
jgi:hypothetical protein